MKLKEAAEGVVMTWVYEKGQIHRKPGGIPPKPGKRPGDHPTLQVAIPQMIVGRVIGKAGATIRSIEERSKARVSLQEEGRAWHGDARRRRRRSRGGERANDGEQRHRGKEIETREGDGCNRTGETSSRSAGRPRRTTIRHVAQLVARAWTALRSAPRVTPPAAPAMLAHATHLRPTPISTRARGSARRVARSRRASARAAASAASRPAIVHSRFFWKSSLAEIVHVE